MGPPNGPPKTPFLGLPVVQIQSKMGGPGGPQKGVFLGGVSAMLSECTTGCLSKTVPNVHFCPKFRVPCLSRMGDLLNTPRNVQNSVPNLSRGGPGEGGVPGGVPHMVGGVPPGPPNGALVNGPYGPSSGSPSQYSPGGVPPWTPQDRAWHRGCQSPPPGEVGPCTRSRSESPLCTRSGRSPPTPLGCCTAGVSGNEPRGSRLSRGGHAMPSLWLHGGVAIAPGSTAISAASE